MLFHIIRLMRGSGGGSSGGVRMRMRVGMWMRKGQRQSDAIVRERVVN